MKIKAGRVVAQRSWAGRGMCIVEKRIEKGLKKIKKEKNGCKSEEVFVF